MSGGTLTMLLAGALLAVPAALLPVLLRVRGAGAYGLSVLIAAAAVIVVISTATSVVHRWTVGWVLAAQLLAAVGAVVLWVRAGRPRPPLPPLPSRPEALAFARNDPLLVIFGGLVLLALAIQFRQAWSVISNGWDPQTYHLSRAAYWVQYAHVGHFEGGTPRQLGYPPNAETLTGWTMMMLRGDRLVNFVQFTALLGSGLAIFAGARLLRFSRRGGVLAALLFIAMPIPIMQATTAQNDLVAAFFVVAGTVLLVRGLRDAHVGELVFGVSALALGVGTKGIVLVAGPSVLLIVAVMAWRLPTARRMLPKALGLGAAALLVFAAYIFVLNLKNTGDLYADARAGTERQAPYVDNAVRVHWSGLADLPGVEIAWLQIAAKQRAPDVLGPHEGPNRFAYAFDTRPDDSTSAFGPVAPLFLIPALLAFAFGWRAPPDRRLAAASALLFLAVFPFAAEYDPDLYRLAASGIALGMPLLAVLDRWRGLAGLAAAFSLLALWPAVLTNIYKPIVRADDEPPTWSLPREAQLGTFRPSIGQALERLPEFVAPDATLGFAGHEHNSWDYPFFGPHHEHRLIRIGEDHDKLTIEQMRAKGMHAAVYDEASPPPWLRRIELAPAIWLVLPEPAPPPPE